MSDALALSDVDVIGYSAGERFVKATALAARNGIAIDEFVVPPPLWDQLLSISGADNRFRWDGKQTLLEFCVGGSWYRVHFGDVAGAYREGELIVRIPFWGS